MCVVIFNPNGPYVALIYRDRVLFNRIVTSTFQLKSYHTISSIPWYEVLPSVAFWTTSVDMATTGVVPSSPR